MKRRLLYLSSGKKVTKYRKRKSINIGVLVFLIIFIYVLISVYIYLTKDHLTIYEVQEGSTSDDNIFTGLIFRDEEVISTDTAGYISYYHGDGDRVSKNATIYSVDENKDSYDLIGNGENAIVLSTDDTSKSSGIITYNIDNYETLSIDAVTADNFKTDEYKRTQLRTMDLIEKGSAVYKIVKSDDWGILIQLRNEQYNKLADKESVKITFSEDGLSTTAPITITQKGADYYARLDINKYMVRYLSKRFIDVEIAVNSAKGLKIPVSSIVEKEFYQIPLSYFTEGGDSGSTGVVKKTFKENGEVQYVFIPTDIYYSDEEFGYIDARLFEVGDRIYSEEKDKEFNISQKQTLEGVFNVNKGYAVFRRIEVLYENEEYCIVKNGTQYGLSVYDHIALDSKTAVEQKIIY